MKKRITSNNAIFMAIFMIFIFNSCDSDNNENASETDTSGWICQSGDCLFVNENATFDSIVECTSTCSNPLSICDKLGNFKLRIHTSDTLFCEDIWYTKYFFDIDYIGCCQDQSSVIRQWEAGKDRFSTFIDSGGRSQFEFSVGESDMVTCSHGKSLKERVNSITWTIKPQRPLIFFSSTCTITGSATLDFDGQSKIIEVYL